MNMNAWHFDPLKLQMLRSFKGASQREFGALIKKSGVTILNWEKGRMSPTARDLVTLANTFGVDPRSFFTQKTADDKKVA